MKIFSVEEANSIAAANKLRMYPTAKRGKQRLLPFARPEVSAQSVIAEDAGFFVTGNCFARSVEKALKLGGKRVLSSPYNPDMPGDAAKQFQRYNIFNLDVATNELLWATRTPERMDDALIRVGDELVDMQLHFTVAYPPEEMRRIRRIYNASYAAIAGADVVIGVLGSTRQWFDRATGIYMNVQPTRRMTSEYPDRFELHQLDVQDLKASLHRFRDTVRQVNDRALMLMIVSPVGQPSSFAAEDALVSQFHSKCVQRVALSNFMEEVADVDYVAALESAFLSDSRFTWVDVSPNHTKPNLGARITADLLRQHHDLSFGQKVIEAHGYGEALMLAEEHEAAVKLLAPVVVADGVAVLERPSDIDLHRMFVTALSRLGQDREALDHLRMVLGDPRYVILLDQPLSDDDRLVDEEEPEPLDPSDFAPNFKRPDHLFNLARTPLFKAGGMADFEALTQYAALRGHDATRLKMREGSASGMREMMKEFVDLYQTGAFAEAIEMVSGLAEAREDLAPTLRRQLDTLSLQAHVKIGQSGKGIDDLLALLAGDKDEPDKRTVTILCNIARSHANAAQIATLVPIARRAMIADLAIQALEERLGRLERKAASGSGR